MKRPGHLRYSRVISAFMTVLFFFLAGLDAFIVTGQRQRLLDDNLKRTRGELALAGTFLTESMLRQEFSVVDQFIDRWGEEQDKIVDFKAITPGGIVLAEYQRDRPAEHTLTVHQVVEFEGQHLLDLEVVKDLAEVEQLLAKLHQQLVWRSVFLTFALGVVLWIIFKVLAIRPLEMEIKKRRQAEDALEGRVAARTIELTEANKRLHEQIKERLQAEAGMAEEKERLAVTLRSIGDGVITTDINGAIILINKVAESMTGWEQEDAVGNSLEDVFKIINAKTRKAFENPIKKILREGRPVGLADNTILVSKNGTERNIADSGAPIMDRESRIVGAVLVFRDVTEKNRMAQDLLKVKKLESVGVLAGGIAHDFNNILAGIIGNVNLAAEIVGPESKAHERLLQAEKAIFRAKGLTRQLLTFARGGSPVKATASMAEVIRESAGFVLHGGNVNCKYEIPDDLWLVEIDKDQMSQVIQNLILNARNAMPEGGVIDVTCENFVKKSDDALPLADGNYIKITIHDSGIGISEKHLEKIFDPYFTTKQQGSGLGLAISHSIIGKHDGHISVVSKPGVGTTFTIYLPAAQKPVRVKDEGGAPPITGTGKILLMDDDEMVLDTAQEILTHLGYEVETTRDGVEALEKYRQARKAGNLFDAVIMDLTVPGGMGGMEATRKLLETDPEARVIVSSGYSNDEVMSTYREHGFRGAIVKPYRLEDIGKLLKKVLNKTEK